MVAHSKVALLKAFACTSIILSTIAKKRTKWVREWIKNRSKLGAFHSLQKELEDQDSASFRIFLRMDKETFTKLLNMVSPYITKKDTVMREAISHKERLALTLRYLASGNSYQDLSYLYRVPKTTLSMIIPETCAAIYDSLCEKYMKVPNSEDEWKNIANEFEERWNFPNCIGALDGKHVCLRHPVGSGAAYYNYKQTFSIVLMALVDADYKFTYIDVRCNGRISDGGVFRECTLHEALEKKSLGIPKPTPLPGRDIDVPYVIVGDEAFPLKPYLMKPYPQRALNDERRIFNYRLSRARRIVENAFGILASRFRIFQKPIALAPEKVEMIILAACALHNFLRSTVTAEVYTPHDSLDRENGESHEVIPGEWRQEGERKGLAPLSRQSGNRHAAYAKSVQQEYCDYFNSNGDVPWQWDKIN